jgi:TFIIF-interacting CTD phosphatase-like protein
MKDRDLGRVILIDNSPHTYLFQKSNAIPIVSFLNDRDDKEMLKLEEFLMQMT